MSACHIVHILALPASRSDGSLALGRYGQSGPALKFRASPRTLLGQWAEKNFATKSLTKWPDSEAGLGRPARRLGGGVEVRGQTVRLVCAFGQDALKKIKDLWLATAKKARWRLSWLCDGLSTRRGSTGALCAKQGA